MTGLLIRMFAERGKDMSPQAVRGRYGTLGSAVGIIVNGLLAALKLLVGMLTVPLPLRRMRLITCPTPAAASCR